MRVLLIQPAAWEDGDRQKSQPKVRRGNTRWLRWLWWMLACALWMGALSAEDNGQSVVKSWTAADGLPSNQVTALAQSADGYLWVGTSAGLARFDGVRFVAYGVAQGLPSIPIMELTALPGGGLWVKNEKGHAYWMRNGSFVRDESPWSYVVAGGDGNVYAYNRAEVVKLDAQGKASGPPISFPEQRNPQGRAGRLQVTPDGRTWVLLRKPEERAAELWSREDGEWRDHGKQGLFMNNARILGMEKSGALWLGGYYNYAVMVNEEQLHKFTFPDQFQWGVNVMEEDGWGRMWAAAWSGGLWIWRGGRTEQQPLNSGQRQPVVSVLLRGRGGEMWAGSSDQGLFRLTKARMMSHQVNQSGTGKVTALLPEADGAVLVGTEGSGIYRWRAEGVSRMTEDAAFNHDCLYGNEFLRLDDGSLWVGAGLGLHEFKDDIRLTDREFSRRFERTGDSILSLSADGEGGFWASTTLGKLWYVRHREIEEMMLPPAKHYGFVSINRDRQGQIWAMGTRGRLLKIAPDRQMADYGKEHGVPDARLATLFIDSKDRIWMGTRGEGLFRWDGERCVPVATSGPRPLGSVMQIQEDAEGWLWLGTLSGICGLDPSRLPEPAPLLWLGTADGMDSEQCMRMRAARDAHGRLYFGTTRGFSVFDPVEIKVPPPSPLPDPVIEELSVERKGMASRWEGKEKLPPGSRFEIAFTGLGPELADDMQFRARLAGLEERWIEVLHGRTMKYGQVPPGEYRFELQAGRQGQWNPQTATLPVRVAPFAWQTWWFRTLLLLAFLGAVAGVFKLVERKRLGKMMAELERHRAVNEERSRIARDLHDSLGAGLTQANMLAHFWEEAQALPAPAKKLKERLRLLSVELDNAVWATNPSFDDLPAVCDYLVTYAANYFEDSGIRCEIDVPERFPEVRVSPRTRQHLLQAVKEALTNVSRHAQASQVRFCLRLAKGWLAVAIHDNGAGFDPQRAAQKGRHGLKHLQERLKLAGGIAHIKTSSSGTVVELSMPLDSAS